MRFLKPFFIGLAITGTAVGSLAATAEPKEQTAGAKPVVDGFYAELLATMKAGNKLGFQGRKAKLEPVVKSSFDLPLMARAVVGPIWYKLKPEDQSAITGAFSDWAVATYANRFTSFNGEQFMVGETSDGGRGTVQVKSTIKPKAAEPVVLSYRLKTDGKNWRIVDVYLNGSISQLANWRAEFAGVMQKPGNESGMTGAGALVTRLKQLSTELAKAK